MSAHTAESERPDADIEPLLGYESDDERWWTVRSPESRQDDSGDVTEWLRIERGHVIPEAECR